MEINEKLNEYKTKKENSFLLHWNTKIGSEGWIQILERV